MNNRFNVKSPSICRSDAPVTSPVLFIILFFLSIPLKSQLTFVESASSWGIDLDMRKDGGLSFGDFDNDGDLDLLVNTDNNTNKSRLYRNNGNSTYTDVTATQAPYLLNSTLERSAVWGDLNNDGYLDFARNTSYTGSNSSGTGSLEIYIQDGSSGVFGDGTGGTTPVLIGSTLSDDVNIGNHNTEGVGFFDFDGDGDLDVVFDNHNFGVDILRNNYIDHTTNTIINPSASSLFSYATPGTGVILGIDQSASDGDYGSVTDVDNDGWVDIFMRKKNQNEFFLNAGGVFTSGSDIAQADNSNKGAVSLYDFDNDGDFDAFWTESDDNQIFRNDGSGIWTGLGASGTTGIPTSFTGDKIDEVSCGDLDNDGDIDILLVSNKRSFLYMNQINDPVLGENVGTPMTFVLDGTNSFNSRDGEGAAMIDIDQDGDLDIYMNINNDVNQLWINQLYTASTPLTDKSYLKFKVLDNRVEYMQTGTERPALGATVTLEDCEGNVISGIREVNGGRGHGSQDSEIVHFGLVNGITEDYRVVVKYPNYINSSGDTIRTSVSKWIKPISLSGPELLIEVRPTDDSTECPGCQTATLNPHIFYYRGKN